MSKVKNPKITDEIKATNAFKFAKERNLTNREAARFSSLFTSEQDFADAAQSQLQVLQLYTRLSMEPNLRRNHNLEQLTTRSKVVAAYELQRKVWVKIVELRNKFPRDVDVLADAFRPSLGDDMTLRQQFLQSLLRKLP